MGKPHRQPFIDPALAPKVSAAEGERRLVREVFEAAVDDLRISTGATTRHGRELYDATRAWFESDEVYVASYSFLRCCEVLDLDPAAVRESLFSRRRGPTLASSETVAVKTCRDCGRLLPAIEFYRHPDTVGGRQNQCRDCARVESRERYRTNRALAAE